MQDSGKKVIFLDRDGTINVDHGYVYKIEDWEWVTGAKESLKKLHDAGFALAIITNQSGVGHGLYSEAQMNALHEFMKEELQKDGVTFAAIAHCPHKRDAGCVCRKPNTGMAKTIEKEIGVIDYSASWTIGDKEADVGFGKAVGARTALIRSRYWTEEALQEKPDYIVESLQEAAEIITN